MTTLNLTPEEEVLVCSALRAKSAQYLGMFGVADPAIDALLAKVEEQLPAPAVTAPAVEAAVEEVVAEVEAVVEEVAAEVTESPAEE